MVSYSCKRQASRAGSSQQDLQLAWGCHAASVIITAQIMSIEHLYSLKSFRTLPQCVRLYYMCAHCHSCTQCYTLSRAKDCAGPML